MSIATTIAWIGMGLFFVFAILTMFKSELAGFALIAMWVWIGAGVYEISRRKNGTLK